jgi:CheY-like chemotaxis protein
MQTVWLMGLLLGMTLVGALEKDGSQNKSLKATLEEKRNNRRILLIYGTDQSQPSLLQQQKILQTEKTGLDERDLDVIVLTATELPETDRQFLAKNTFQLTSVDVFKGWLIGKDGGVKHTFKKPIKPGELFRIIDSMPMRQAETRRQ